jgi:hypothetical protein
VSELQGKWLRGGWDNWVDIPGLVDDGAWDRKRDRLDRELPDSAAERVGHKSRVANDQVRMPKFASQKRPLLPWRVSCLRFVSHDDDEDPVTTRGDHNRDLEFGEHVVLDDYDVRPGPGDVTACSPDHAQVL